MKKELTIAVFIIIDNENRVKPTEETFHVKIESSFKKVESENAFNNFMTKITDQFLSLEDVRTRINENYFRIKESKKTAVICRRIYSTKLNFIQEHCITGMISNLIKERLFSLKIPEINQKVYINSDDERTGGLVIIEEIKPDLQGNKPRMTFRLKLKEFPNGFTWWSKELYEKQDKLAKKFGDISAKRI